MVAHERAGPMLESGGGNTSSSQVQSIVQFSQPILERLLHIYKDIPSLGNFQDDRNFDSESSWLSYMSSSSSQALSPSINHDLSYPISNYYISSSHNTYLSGNQLYGEASTDSYRNVLERGCRCLEIDVWDGDDTSSSSSDAEEGTQSSGKHARRRAHSKQSRWHKFKSRMRSRSRSTEGRSSRTDAQQPAEDRLPSPWRAAPSRKLSPARAEPRVLHGYTLTKQISFRSVCHAIRDSAFKATSLPIIVSLEVHAGLGQQEVMVDIMKACWEGHLVDITGQSESEISALPSPESLRNKILIKVKWTPNTQTGESNDPLDHVETNDSDQGFPEGSPEKARKASKILAALSQLGVYTRAYTFKQFDQPEASLPTHVFSLSEDKVQDMHADSEHGPQLFNHNRNFLMRVFPSGRRINSSNVEPTFLWRQGAQMVALNWQRLDRGMMLNEGMFAGAEGWVLKPEGYRGTHKTSADSKNRQNTPQGPMRQTLDLEITVLAAQNLPLPIEKELSHRAHLKPYVTFQLHVDTCGPPGHQKGNPTRRSDEDEENEEKKLKRRTRTARSTDPEFGDETLRWSSVPGVVEQLSFLRYVFVVFVCVMRFRTFSAANRLAGS